MRLIKGQCLYSEAVLCVSFHVIEGLITCDQIGRIASKAFHSFLWKSKPMLALYIPHMHNSNLEIRIVCLH